LLQAPVEAVVTAAPKTVLPDQLAIEAMQLLNAAKITGLIVAELDHRSTSCISPIYCAQGWREHEREPGEASCLAR
jgi:hypothetical protein